MLKMNTEDKRSIGELIGSLGETLGNSDNWSLDKFDLEEEKRESRKDLGLIALGAGILTGVEGYATYAQLKKAQKASNEAARVAQFPEYTEYLKNGEDVKGYLIQHDRAITTQYDHTDNAHLLAELTGATALIFAFVAGKYFSKLFDSYHEKKMARENKVGN